MISDRVVLRSFANEIEARIAQIVLEAHGIPSVLWSDDAGGMLPTLQFLHGVRLIVRREDVDEALAALEPSG